MVNKTASRATFVEDQLALLGQIAELVSTHPGGSNLRVVLVQDSPQLGEGEVLIQQQNDRGIVELVPCALDSLGLDDVIHATQELDPQNLLHHKRATPGRHGICQNSDGSEDHRNN